MLYRYQGQRLSRAPEAAKRTLDSLGHPVRPQSPSALRSAAEGGLQAALTGASRAWRIWHLATSSGAQSPSRSWVPGLPGRLKPLPASTTRFSSEQPPAGPSTGSHVVHKRENLTPIDPDSPNHQCGPNPGPTGHADCARSNRGAPGGRPGSFDATASGRSGSEPERSRITHAQWWMVGRLSRPRQGVA